MIEIFFAVMFLVASLGCIMNMDVVLDIWEIES